MKIRKFYPLQVYRRLAGRKVSGLEVANLVALNNAVRRSRKLGLAVTIVGDHIDVRTPTELGRMMLGDLRDNLAFK